MSYLVSKLISEAYYTSGIVSREFNQVQGDQEQTGFDKLNEILSDTAIDVDMIPYFTTSYTFPAIVNQQRYFIPNLDELETLTFFLDNIRYQMRKNMQDVYFGQGRAENIQSLPFNWHVERTFGGSHLFIYFFPDRAYPMEITGRFRLQNVTPFQDLQSAVTTANLGVPLIYGNLIPPAPVTGGLLNPGELVINGFDCTGRYSTATALATYISNNVSFVNAALVNGQFILTSNNGASILVSTLGTQTLPDAFSFSAFSTMDGQKNQTFMSMVLDQYYINYLQYRLADRLCTSYNIALPPGAQKELDKYMQLVSKGSSPVDLSVGKLSSLGQQTSISYAQVNLGRGWTPLG